MHVLIADRHPVARTGLKKILSAALPGVSFGEAETDAEMLECIPHERWNLVILEATYPIRTVADSPRHKELAAWILRL